VEPVGVETTTPSAAKAPTGSPSIQTTKRTTRANPPLWSTTSLSERQCIWGTPSRVSAAACNPIRRSEK
jgi:hypothetical protein